jgi:type IV secretion system protein VirD4
VRPFYSDKYDLTKHQNYKYTADADKKNIFDIEKFLRHDMKLRPDETYEVIDAEEA